MSMGLFLFANLILLQMGKNAGKTKNYTNDENRVTSDENRARGSSDERRGSTRLVSGGEKMARPEKEAIVNEVHEKLMRSQGVVLVDFRGLTVQEATELRKQLREAGVEFRVFKNTLIRFAAEKANLSDLTPYLEGPTAIAFGYNDPVSPAKILSNFAKSHKKLELKGGVLEGKVIDRAMVTALAELPTREVLLGQLAGLLQAPLRNLANVLSAPIRNTVYVLEAIRKKKAEVA